MISIEKSITFGRVKDETFLVNSKTGKALKLDLQGTKIWNLIYRGYSKVEIKDYLVMLYPDDGKKVEKDVDTFFEILQNEKIIKERD